MRRRRVAWFALRGGSKKKELEMEEHLDRIMQELPRKERDALLLRHVHDYSVAEIGAMMGLSEEGAKKLGC